MIYITGNSIARRRGRDRGKTYGEILGATYLESFHTQSLPNAGLGIYTILGADDETENLKLKDHDFIVIHAGANDCIYRKNKAYVKMYNTLAELSVNSKHHELFKSYSEKFSLKKEDELLQMITFEKFESVLDTVLSRFNGNTCIVISLSCPEHYRMSYAINELTKTNQILYQQSIKHNAYFIDIFKTPGLTWEGVHFTKHGHIVVAEKILTITSESF